MEDNREKLELANANCSSMTKDKVLYNDDNEVEDEKLKNISKAQSSAQIFDSDSDEGNFETLALGFVVEENTDEPITETFFRNEVPKFVKNFKKLTSEQNTVESKNHIFFYQSRNLTKSVSADAILNEAKVTEIPYKSYFNNKLVGDNSQTLLELQEQLKQVTKKLKQKTIECETLTQENKERNHLLDPVASENQNSLFKRMRSYTSGRKSLIMANLVINTLNKQIIDYKIQLQEKDVRITKLQENVITQAQILKQNFYKRTEVQKEILEEMDLRCTNMEEKLNVERKLRKKRETEISHIQTYINKSEKCFRNQIDDQDACIKRIEAQHIQEMATMGKLIKQKDEEISQLNQTYGPIWDICQQQAQAINLPSQEQPLSDTFRLEEIKLRALEQIVQLKRKQLYEAHTEIVKLQKQLNSKHHEMEEALLKLSKTKEQGALKQKLENIRQQIGEILNVFEQEPYSCSSETASKDSTKPDFSQVFLKRMGDKEEVD